MCIVRSRSVLAIYSHDERPRKTTGTGYDMERSMQNTRLGIFPYGLMFTNRVCAPNKNKHSCNMNITCGSITHFSNTLVSS